jgi:DNA-binding NarL/FixJ family response regulator
VASGRPFVNPAVAEQLAFNVQPKDTQLPHITLSERESDVFTSLLNGDSVKQIAATMGISIKTVSTHKARMMAKMGVSTVSQLVQYAVKHHLLSVPVD